MVKNNQVGGDGDFPILEGIVTILGDIFNGLASFLGMVGDVPSVAVVAVAEQAGVLADAANTMAGEFIETVGNAASSTASGVVGAVTEMGAQPLVLGHQGVLAGQRFTIPGTYNRSSEMRQDTYESVSDSDSDSDSDEDDDLGKTLNLPSICEGGWKERGNPELHCPDGEGGWKVYSSAKAWRDSMTNKVGGGQLVKIRKAVNKIKATQKKINKLSVAIKRFRGTGNVALAVTRLKRNVKLGGKRRRTRKRRKTRKKRRTKKRKTKRRR